VSNATVKFIELSRDYLLYVRASTAQSVCWLGWVLYHRMIAFWLPVGP